MNTKQKAIDHPVRAAALQATPNRWKKIGSYGTQKSAYEAARQIRKGVGGLARHYPGKYDTKVREGIEVWAKYVGQ